MKTIVKKIIKLKIAKNILINITELKISAIFSLLSLLIEISFKFILMSVPLLLLFSCLIPFRLPPFGGMLSLGAAIVLAGVFLIKKERLGSLIRIALFISIPFIIYFSEVYPAEGVPGSVLFIYDAWGAITILFIILTMKLTRRNDGLKATPLHFLILGVALIIPNLPGLSIPDFHLGMVAAKIIFFFFGFEVLIGELRNKLNWLCFVTVLSFVVLAAKAGLVF